jgi:hypothetical protein
VSSNDQSIYIIDHFNSSSDQRIVDILVSNGIDDRSHTHTHTRRRRRRRCRR